MSLILAPFAWLSPSTARIVWILVSVVSWAAGLAILADGLGLGSFHGVPPFVWLTAATTPFPPLAENLVRGQAYVLLFLLLCLVVRLVLKAKRLLWCGGIPIGLMLILKSGGLWLWPLFAAAGRWRLLAGAGATAMVIVCLCSPFMGWQIWPIYASQALRWLPSEPSNHMTAYQTVQSLAGHLFIRDPAWNPAPVAHVPWLAALLSSLVLGTLFAFSVRREDIGSGLLRRRALTVGMFIAPMVPVAPIGEGYHYVLVFPAVMIGWWWAFREPATTAKRKALMVASTTLICAPQRYYSSRHLQEGWAVLLAYPRVYGALALWGTLAYALKESFDADRPRCRVRG